MVFGRAYVLVYGGGGGGGFGAADKKLQAFVGNCPTLSWVYSLLVNEYTEAGRPDNFPICPTKQ